MPGNLPIITSARDVAAGDIENPDCFNLKLSLLDVVLQLRVIIKNVNNNILFIITV